MSALRTDYFFRAWSWICFLSTEAQQRRRLTNTATVSAARHKPLLPGQPGHQPDNAAHMHRPHRRSRLAHAHRSAGGVHVRERAAFSQPACPVSCTAAGGAAAPQDEVSRVAQRYACACVVRYVRHERHRRAHHWKRDKDSIGDGRMQLRGVEKHRKVI